MTNREKIREVFPHVIFIYQKVDDKTNAIMCTDEWLDSEYIEPQESDEIKFCVEADYINPEEFFDGEYGVSYDGLYYDEAKKLAEELQNDGVHKNVVMYESENT